VFRLAFTHHIGVGHVSNVTNPVFQARHATSVTYGQAEDAWTWPTTLCRRTKCDKMMAQMVDKESETGYNIGSYKDNS